MYTAEYEWMESAHPEIGNAFNSWEEKKWETYADAYPVL